MVFCNFLHFVSWVLNWSHNPYFNRWFSAITLSAEKALRKECHNPYFNRWFSAISKTGESVVNLSFVTILILIDGFLQ